MKAFLTAHDVAFRKTPDLDVVVVGLRGDRRVLERLARSGPRSERLRLRLQLPRSRRTPAQTEAREALTLARSAVAAIRERLGSVAGA